MDPDSCSQPGDRAPARVPIRSYLVEGLLIYWGCLKIGEHGETPNKLQGVERHVSP